MERRLTPRGRERRRQLMSHAARCFATNGYHPTSVAEIVGAAGVGKGVFYWYFRSKEELFLEILRGALQDLRRRQQHAIGDEPDPVRRIESGIRASMDWLAENRHLFRLIEVAAIDDRFAGAVRLGQEIALDDVARHVKEGIVAGRIRESDPLLLAGAVLGVTQHLARAFLLDGHESPDAIADAAVDFCLGGLLLPAEGAATA